MTGGTGKLRGSILRRAYVRYASVAWNGVAYALPKAALLVASLYVANQWGHEAFARYSLAAVTLMLVGNLAGSSLATAVSKYVPEFAGGDAFRIGTGFSSMWLFAAVLAGVLGLGVFVFAPALAGAFAVQPPITGLLQITACAVGACVFSGGTSGILAGSSKFKQAALVNIGAMAAFAATIVPFGALAGPGGVLGALAIYYATSAIVSSVVLRAPLLHDWRASHRSNVKARSGTVLRYFVPMLLAAGMITPVVWLCNAMLTRSASALGEVARFAAAYNWFAVVSTIPAVLAQVEFVRMAKSRAAGDLTGLTRAFRVFTLQNFLFVAPIVAIGAALAGVLGGLYRIDDADSRLCIRLFLASALIASLGNPAGLFLAVIDRIWIASALNAGWAVITLGCAWWLKGAGAKGVGVAFLIGYGAHFLVASAVAWRVIGRIAPARSPLR